MAPEGSLRIAVAYALPGEQIVVPLDVPAGTTVEQAITLSGLALHYPDLRSARAGIYGREIGPGTMLVDGDRVELYRPLRADLRQARRGRVARRP